MRIALQLQFDSEIIFTLLQTNPKSQRLSPLHLMIEERYYFYELINSFNGSKTTLNQLLELFLTLDLLLP